MECDEEYIGESSRTFGERFREHQKAPSPIYDHFNITGHNVTIVNFSIMGRKDQNLLRTIKEALYIRVNNTSLNRNICKYHLWFIYRMRFCLTPQNSNYNKTDPSGYSICHIGNNIYQNIAHPAVAIPSATLAITSAI